MGQTQSRGADLPPDEQDGQHGRRRRSLSQTLDGYQPGWLRSRRALRNRSRRLSQHVDRSAGPVGRHYNWRGRDYYFRPPPVPPHSTRQQHYRHSNNGNGSPAAAHSAALSAATTNTGVATDANRPGDRIGASTGEIAATRPLLRQTASDEPLLWLPQVQVPALDVSVDDLSRDGAPLTRETSVWESRGVASSISERLSSARVDRSLRSMTNSLRRRRSPIRRGDDQAAMLSQLLSAAAAATAASLMGEDHRPATQTRGSSTDGDDGTFDGFLRALQSGRIAAALRQSNDEAEAGAGSAAGQSAPLNFFRMFRFGSSGPQPDSGTLPDAREIGGSSSGGGGGSGNSQNGEHSMSDAADGRMVPIIIVGIRSINPSNGTGAAESIPPFLEALSNFPAPRSTTPHAEPTMDGILNRASPGSRFSHHRRRASMGGVNVGAPNNENQRQPRIFDHSRPWTTNSDTPVGPRPPPSTPASPGLSAVSSGNNTPTRLSSSAVPSRRESFIRRSGAAAVASPSVGGEDGTGASRTSRPRRLSESDFTRFGSGDARRNGVVEPDSSSTDGSRSWIIYVLGGSYPENHPILTTPSLFTDSPTYEDMLLLSTLLGPAKPPVASETDVAAAPGLFHVVTGEADALVAVGLADREAIALAHNERCLVCLCEYEATDVARRLVQCQHMFHRECIDQVSLLLVPAKTIVRYGKIQRCNHR